MFPFLPYQIGGIASFLCMSRDVSNQLISLEGAPQFSLHAQRCFQLYHHDPALHFVFSACAEMFPTVKEDQDSSESFLCIRRDVSLWIDWKPSATAFSLHAQRCSCRAIQGRRKHAVFSVCAEMFPAKRSRFSTSIRFLCMRRDLFFDIKPQWFALYSA